MDKVVGYKRYPHPDLGEVGSVIGRVYLADGTKVWPWEVDIIKTRPGHKATPTQED
jgi:hypothetical protein